MGFPRYNRSRFNTIHPVSVAIRYQSDNCPFSTLHMIKIWIYKNRTGTAVFIEKPTAHPKLETVTALATIISQCVCECVFLNWCFYHKLLWHCNNSQCCFCVERSASWLAVTRHLRGPFQNEARHFPSPYWLCICCLAEFCTLYIAWLGKPPPGPWRPVQPAPDFYTRGEGPWPRGSWVSQKPSRSA